MHPLRDEPVRTRQFHAGYEAGCADSEAKLVNVVAKIANDTSLSSGKRAYLIRLVMA